MKKISVLGDSISKGIILENTKYRCLENSFANMFCDKYTINNFSIFGCTITKGMQIFNRQYEKICSSDIVITEFGGNDCDFKWSEISKNPDGTFKPNTTLEIFLSSYKNMIENILSENKKAVVLNLPPLDDEKYFHHISIGNNKDNILKWLGGSTHYIYRWHEMYNDAVYQVAAEMNVMLIDIRTEFLKLRNYSEYLCDDGIHPNENGHKLIYYKLLASV